MPLQLGALAAGKFYVGASPVSAVYLGSMPVYTAIPFSPLQLFAAGEQGVWYDPSDMSTMFQDAAGTTPVTAVEQPVGRILDKSGRGNHANQPTATARPVLKIDGSGKHYLQFDGVDDQFTINAPWFSSAQGHTSFGGISFGAGANGLVINSDLSIRTAQLFRIGGGVTNNLVFNTAVSVFSTPGVSVSPDTPLVLSQSTTTALLTSKLNKAVIGTAAITGTLQTTAGLFRIGGANCRVYSLIHVANVVANDQITQTENWVNSKTGAF